MSTYDHTTLKDTTIALIINLEVFWVLKAKGYGTNIIIRKEHSMAAVQSEGKILKLNQYLLQLKFQAPAISLDQSLPRSIPSLSTSKVPLVSGPLPSTPEVTTSCSPLKTIGILFPAGCR